ncbi:hypothetical protein HOD96_03230 [Candidatus Falkowbacteria bacterium]|jgi:hypothetical protein|nr:hypothetical protein [Candidatus Falkowbacteria bacterium]MBT4432730.1 hypothetical protein [Candidatus Falkowbacteria bacterium]
MAYLLSDFKLKVGYWIVTHKIFIKKLAVFGLFVLNILLVSFSFVKLVEYYSVGSVQFEKMIHQLGIYNIDYVSYQRKNAPQNIKIIEIDSINLGNNKYSFIAKAKNPNINKWVATELEYYFVYNNQKTEKSKTFILPGDEKFFGSFNIESPTKIARPRLVISGVKWERIRAGDLEDFLNKIKEHVNFSITDEKFLNASDLGVQSEGPMSAIRFTAENKTIYGYYEVGFFVVTYVGPVITSANFFQIDSFLPQEKREVELRWHGAISRPSRIEIIPEINIMDKNFIMRENDTVGLPK